MHYRDWWKWNAAVKHSQEHPGHILGPYEGNDGQTEIDRNECGFDTAELPEPATP